MSGRRIGPRATALLHHFEACSLESYLCPAGKWTIGWGNTRYEDGSRVRGGQRISQERADALFRNILAGFEAHVERLTNGAIGQTSAAQFGAMVCLAYNIGVGTVRPPGKPGFTRSSVRRFHNLGQHQSAANSFLMWNKSNGRVLRGLTRRRQAERLLYLNNLAAFDKAIGYKP